ncbi:hypothetical protein D3C85_885070 [compost metagenome]
MNLSGLFIKMGFNPFDDIYYLLEMKILVLCKPFLIVFIFRFKIFEILKIVNSVAGVKHGLDHSGIFNEKIKLIFWVIFNELSISVFFKHFPKFFELIGIKGIM